MLTSACSNASGADAIAELLFVSFDRAERVRPSALLPFTGVDVMSPFELEIFDQLATVLYSESDPIRTSRGSAFTSAAEHNRTRLAREMFRVWPGGVDLNSRGESATS
jgi:hypothetical protein